MAIKVKNTSPKVIGFGNIHVVQEQTVDLPNGFDAEHPTIKYLINRGWLTVITRGGIALPPGTKTEVEHVEEPPVESVENPTRRQIERMNLDALRGLASRNGIEFDPAATRAVLIDLILESWTGAQEE